MTGPKKYQPYGTWKSGIAPENPGLIRKLSEPHWAADGSLLWRERQSDQPRLMIFPPGGDAQVLDPALKIGGGILYGGGSFTVRGDQLAAVESRTARLIHLDLANNRQITLCELEGKAASPQISPRGEFLLFIHSHQERDTIRLVGIKAPSPPEVLVSGADFYNYPRWHPSGEWIAWVSWNHPDMPWDSSRLFLAHLEELAGDTEPAQLQRVAGGQGVSVLQPEFSPDGRFLAFLSDRSGWWQLYLHDLTSGRTRQLTDEAADHGLPAWLQNQLTYTFSPDSRSIIVIRNLRGFASLWRIDLQTGKESQLKVEGEYTWLEGMACSPEGHRLALVASSGVLPERLITVELDGSSEIIRHATPFRDQSPGYSRPQQIAWPGFDGKQIHGLFYFPQHPRYQGEGQPPLLVFAHSGPTRQTWADYHPRTQYFTSRGYAVLEVNYRGSTGYGREYWEALQGQWGVLDVSDCVSGARFAAAQGWADPTRMAMYGSSAGGYTVLQTLVNFPGIFSAGISLYGIANQITLLENPPKFERYYSDWLLGPYPENEQRYRDRSPLFQAHQIREPVAIFQGGKDPVVPPSQAERIVAALRDNGIPCEYHVYPQESHGFKKSETIQDVYQKLEAFLRKTLLGL